MQCKLRPRPHAKKRMLERGIVEEEIRQAILHGSLKRHREATASGPARWKWEAKTQAYHIVFHLRPCSIMLKTVMYPR